MIENKFIRTTLFGFHVLSTHDGPLGWCLQMASTVTMGILRSYGGNFSKPF